MVFRKAGYFRRLLSGGSTPKLTVCDRMGGGGYPLFWVGWRNIEIAVHDGRYLEAASKIAAEFEALSGKFVTILTKF